MSGCRARFASFRGRGTKHEETKLRSQTKRLGWVENRQCSCGFLTVSKRGKLWLLGFLHVGCKKVLFCTKKFIVLAKMHRFTRRNSSFVEDTHDFSGGVYAGAVGRVCTDRGVTRCGKPMHAAVGRQPEAGWWAFRGPASDTSHILRSPGHGSGAADRFLGERYSGIDSTGWVRGRCRPCRGGLLLVSIAHGGAALRLAMGYALWPLLRQGVVEKACESA